MLQLLLQSDGNFPFKMVLGQILGMVSDKLDLCKMSAAGNGAGLLGILSFIVYAVFIIVMVIWGAMIIYNIFNTGGSSGKREEEDGTTSSGGATSSASMGLTAFGAAIKKNAAGQIIPIIIWTIVVIVGMATSNC